MGSTPLTPEQKAKFARALAELAKNGKRDVSGDESDYDLQGLYKDKGADGLKQLQDGHGTDTYKKPNHPTFSDESKWSNPKTPGGHWGEDGTYTPSPDMLRDKSRRSYLEKYMAEAEPDTKLRAPPVDEYNLAKPSKRRPR